jgi:hypothetical protein
LLILFAVTENSSNQTKASVSKLKPKHLSQLVEQPDINLGQLYSLKNVKVHPVVSLENGTSHPKKENVPDALSESVSTEESHLRTELTYDSCAKMSEMEDLDLSDCKDELLYSVDTSVDDLELKSEVENLDAGVLEHNGLLGDLACHNQEIEEFDEPAVETVSVEEQYDEPAVKTMVVPVPEVAQAKPYV